MILADFLNVVQFGDKVFLKTKKGFLSGDTNMLTNMLNTVCHSKIIGTDTHCHGYKNLSNIKSITDKLEQTDRSAVKCGVQNFFV